MHALTSDGQMLVAPGLQSAPAFSATLDAVIQGKSLNSASYCISFARLELERNKREEIKLSKSDSGSVCLKLYSKACSVGMVPKVRDFAACSNSARRLVLANNACNVSLDNLNLLSILRFGCNSEAEEKPIMGHAGRKPTVSRDVGDMYASDRAAVCRMA